MFWIWPGSKIFHKKIVEENKTLELSVTSRQKTHKSKFEGIIFNSYEFNNKKFDKNINIKIQDRFYLGFNSTN